MGRLLSLLVLVWRDFVKDEKRNRVIVGVNTSNDVSPRSDFVGKIKQRVFAATGFYFDYEDRLHRTKGSTAKKPPFEGRDRRTVRTDDAMSGYGIRNVGSYAPRSASPIVWCEFRSVSRTAMI
jgi:hypothetical protein